jgi:hypothetical protein
MNLIKIQNLIDCADDPQSKFNELERVTKLRRLCEEFAENAARIGKIIISELFLDDSQKTIPSITRYFFFQTDVVSHCVSLCLCLCVARLKVCCAV